MPQHARLSVCIALVVIAQVAAHSARPQDQKSLHSEIAALDAEMVAAFKRDPSSVAAFYTNDAAIIGGGQRYQGRAAVDAYWKGATMFRDWTLEVIEIGGTHDAPWQYGRSVLTSSSGRAMETYFVGLLRRQSSGELKFQVDVFTRERQDTGAVEAGEVMNAYLKAVESGDATALNRILDEAFVIVSSTARDKAQEIADLVPKPGVSIPYFRSDDTRTRGFGALAITTGVLKWQLAPGGREIERQYASVAVKRGSEWKILAQQVTPRR
jgi:ketosteroid isomerase-like protein